MSKTLNPEAHRRLAELLGPKGFITDTETLAPHLVDWRGRYTGDTPCLLAPATTREVSAAVRICAEHALSMTPQGGNTGLVGGQIPMGEVLISTRRMNSIRSVDPLDDTLIAEAGVTLSAVHHAAADAERMFPLSLASEGSATIGGLISTNAGGVHVMRYGMMRDLVLGLEAVLPDGRIWNGLSRLRKNNTGYDLKSLLIGAEGTLGIVTAAVLRIFPAPHARLTALAAIPTAEAALALLHRLKAAEALSVFELINHQAAALAVQNVPDTACPLPETPFYALIEFEASRAEALRETVEAALAAALDQHEIHDAVIAETEGQRAQFWKLRESLPAGHRKEGAQANHDISVPVSSIPRFLVAASQAIDNIAPGARIVAFGHMGDGNLHYSVLKPHGLSDETLPVADLTDAITDIAVKMHGSFSAEHGVGAKRLADMTRYKDPLSLELMRTLKAALDPLRTMNPRVLIP